MLNVMRDTGVTSLPKEDRMHPEPETGLSNSAYT